MNLLEQTKSGLYCPLGGFYIDPHRKVDKAVITHGHSDHAREGSSHYLTHPITAVVMKERFKRPPNCETIEYGVKQKIGDVELSLFPAGHVPGSAQILIEYKGYRSVVSGDYKTVHDGVSTGFEPVRCHEFITETTFGLPIYHWPSDLELFEEIDIWWNRNASRKVTSIIYSYSLGKAQRLLLNLKSREHVFVHSAIHSMNKALSPFLSELRQFRKLTEHLSRNTAEKALIISPPAGGSASWPNTIEPFNAAMASGWMAVDRSKQSRSSGQGFVVSDHADWSGLNRAVLETGAEKVYTTHGFSLEFAEWLRTKGIDAKAIPPKFIGALVDIPIAEIQANR